MATSIRSRPASDKRLVKRGIELVVVGAIAVVLGGTISYGVVGFRSQASASACLSTNAQVRRALDERWAIKGSYPTSLQALVDEQLVGLSGSVRVATVGNISVISGADWNVVYRYTSVPTPHFSLEPHCGA